MDLNQRKLTATEWNSIEVPTSPEEQWIGNLIQDGYSDVMIKRNETSSLLQYLKVADSDDIDRFVFARYLQSDMKKIIKYAKKTPIAFESVKNTEKSIRKADLIRFANTDSALDTMKDSLYEFVLLSILKTTIKAREKGNKAWVMGYYTMVTLLGYSVSSCNRALYAKINEILSTFADEEDTHPRELVYRAAELIEYNPYLLKYADAELYDHQRRLFTQFKNARTPQLVLYIAPTGTGKTMSPLGLAQGYKIIFVCAARHVGLALAKAAISMGRKVAFAFGCVDAEGIRLHYGAAKDYTRDRRSGAIRKVDNSVGDRVEIIISDLKSYLPAMHYMCAFNKKEEIITYWDEPTITLDYADHECHEIIQRNWSENLIPNMVLSSATLPQQDELAPTIRDFQSRFDDAEITSIVSYDCKKTIPLVNKAGYVEMPHHLYKDYNDIRTCAEYVLRNKTLLRYLDLDGCVELIQTVCQDFPDSIADRYSIGRQFQTVENVNMLTVKTYYLKLLANINPEYWGRISAKLEQKRTQKHKSNIYVNTRDAHTLTDGPTIFLSANPDKIGKFCMQQAQIPDRVLTEIMSAIDYNAVVNGKIATLTKTLEDLQAKDEAAGNDKKLGDVNRGSPEIKVLRKDIDELRKCIMTVQLPDKYIPNMAEHLKRFAPDIDATRAFKPRVTEDEVEKIMLIDDIEDHWKLLLMMGIGVFAQHESDRYMEIMKHLAMNQKLYLIIASTDFIYGTNYQFCHGYLSSDLQGMSQEKAIQAMGRVGRNKLQFDYSLRFRNDDILKSLFEHDADKPEVANMARLFNS